MLDKFKRAWYNKCIIKKEVKICGTILKTILAIN